MPRAATSGDDDVQRAGFQLLDDAFAHLLVEVAVQRGGGIAAGGKFVGQFDGGGPVSYTHLTLPTILLV